MGPQSSWKYPKYYLFILGFSFFFCFFDIVNIGLALPKLMLEFHISNETAALAITTSLVGYIVGAVLDSLFSDCYGRKKALIVSLLFFSVGSLFCGLSHSFDGILFWRFVTGMGVGAQIAVITTYTSELAPPQSRGKMVSIVIGCGMLGFAVVPFIAYVLVPNFAWGWRGLFILGALGALMVLFLWRHLPDSPLWEQAQKGKKTPFDLRVLFHGKTLLSLSLFIAIWFVYYIGNYGWLTLAATLLVNHGFALGQSLLFVALTSCGFVLGALLSMGLGDKIERKKACAVIALIWIASLLVVGFIPHPIAIIGGGLVASTTIAMIIPQMYTLTAEQFPTHVRATCIAITDGVGHLGGALCGQIIFFVADFMKPQGFFFQAALATMAATGLITLGLLLLAQNKTGKELA